MCVLAANLHADVAQPTDIAARARATEGVVVATIADANATFAKTEHGAQIIVSQVTLTIDDDLKRPSRDTILSIDVEGGTVGDLTLDVSRRPAHAHDRVRAAGQRQIKFVSPPQNCDRSPGFPLRPGAAPDLLIIVFAMS